MCFALCKYESFLLLVLVGCLFHAGLLHCVVAHVGWQLLYEGVVVFL